jgi:hypothetical protein
MKQINIALLASVALLVAAAANGQGVDYSKVEIKTTDLGNKTYMLEGQGGNQSIRAAPRQDQGGHRKNLATTHQVFDQYALPRRSCRWKCIVQ